MTHVIPCVLSFDVDIIEQMKTYDFFLCLQNMSYIILSILLCKAFYVKMFRAVCKRMYKHTNLILKKYMKVCIDYCKTSSVNLKSSLNMFVIWEMRRKQTKHSVLKKGNCKNIIDGCKNQRNCSIILVYLMYESKIYFNRGLFDTGVCFVVNKNPVLLWNFCDSGMQIKTLSVSGLISLNVETRNN